MSHRHPDPTSQRSTRQGDVIGFSFNAATHAWWGIPFAAPPLGELRWRAPQPHPGWSTPRECVNFGKMSTQLKSFMTLSPPQEWNKPTGSEDCLTLNVFAPKNKAEKPLPVMVWIHGGGNTSGSSSMYSIAGNLPEHGNVVVVSVNYRLGVLGWFYHPALFDENCSEADKSG
ncbi:MAG TPA: carboxylesterase family protein, partial [Pseudomonadales bacterium]|nr:carboxylesterase family protein [Pseudomonadales bacterium]